MVPVREVADLDGPRCFTRGSHFISFKGSLATAVYSASCMARIRRMIYDSVFTKPCLPRPGQLLYFPPATSARGAPDQSPEVKRCGGLLALLHRPVHQTAYHTHHGQDIQVSCGCAAPSISACCIERADIAPALCILRAFTSRPSNACITQPDSKPQKWDPAPLHPKRGLFEYVWSNKNSGQSHSTFNAMQREADILTILRLLTPGYSLPSRRFRR